MSKCKLNRDVLRGSRIFVVDDEDLLAWSIETELKTHGAEVLSCNSIRSALGSFPAFGADVAICDLGLPDGNGMELLRKWRQEKPDMPIILVTAHGAVQSAVDALRLGAFDYLQKPFDLKALIAAVQRAAELSALRQKISHLTGHEGTREPVRMVGNSLAMKVMRQQVQRVAESKSGTVLILGESGTGKELAARAIHQWSDRKEAPFVEINCASIPESLLESELFGYEKGAFTDARDRKLGLLELAQNGTIFLDEIGEMPMKLQTKLLRVLEYRRFKRLGGTRDINFTARIVAATNRNLLEEIHQKTFRSDLYYRISALPIYICPLRERLEDLDELVAFFLKSIARDLFLDERQVSPDAIARLRLHPWPGNLRELKNVLERALVFHDVPTIEARHLQIDPIPREDCVQRPQPGYGAAEERQHHPMVLPEEGIRLEDLERDLLCQALDLSHNNQTKAADLLGITRHTLRYRLEKHGLARV